MSTWSDPELISLFEKKTPLIDVRAPVEFSEGAIPNSINLPIMNDEERHAVGTCYKEHGQQKAIELGHALVSGKIKDDRISRWHQYLDRHPEAEVFCFRGGLRSQISCQWIGRGKNPVPGGYKRLRRFFLSWLEEAPLPKLLRIGGLTGSGKTRVLKKLNPHLDLEGHASHRGSAFGLHGAQPSQVTFENLIALDLMHFRDSSKIVIEDESATLGKLTVPQRLFLSLRQAPLVILEVSHDDRIKNIFEDYVQGQTPEFFQNNLVRIQKKLGTKKVTELSHEIALAFSGPQHFKTHEKWISVLLEEYYDPLYQKDLRHNREKVIFQGPEQDLLAFVQSY